VVFILYFSYFSSEVVLKTPLGKPRKWFVNPGKSGFKKLWALVKLPLRGLENHLRGLHKPLMGFAQTT
jgi:hypothetical protein